MVILANPPWGEDSRECAGRFNSPSVCVSSISERHQLKSEVESAAATKFANASYIRTRQWICVEDSCPIYASGRLVRVDRAHLTNDTAKMLAPLLSQEITRQNMTSTSKVP